MRLPPRPSTLTTTRLPLALSLVLPLAIPLAIPLVRVRSPKLGYAHPN